MRRVLLKLLGGFDTADLVSFGNYCLSSQRRAAIFMDDSGRDVDEKAIAFNRVNDADLSNWAVKNGKRYVD